MKTRAVSRPQWPQLCQRLTQNHHGSMVRLEVLESNGTKHSVAEDVPLQSISFAERRNECSDEIVIEAGLPDERPMQHRVVEPFEIRLKDGSNNDRFNHIEILAESGTVEMTLNPGLLPNELD
jgi:hypothetical protein